MIRRAIETEFLTLLREFPVVTVLGPRQAGKTTLVRKLLKDYTYVSLENPELRQLAKEDPKQFLVRYPKRVIFDEVQRVPLLLSYLQGIVDEDPSNGQFVLTGSHQLELNQAVSQSLAGRTAILTLYPFSLAELAEAEVTFESFEEAIVKGFLPRIYDPESKAIIRLLKLLQNLCQRDVRQLIQLKDVSVFEKFITLLAGRVGQLVDHTSLGNDVGVDGKTIKN